MQNDCVIRLEKVANLFFFCYIVLRKKYKIDLSVSNQNFKTGTNDENRPDTNAKKIPQKVSSESSGTYEEYGTNTSYAAYETDISYERYLDTYQDYHDFKKFQIRKFRRESSQYSDLA